MRYAINDRFAKVAKALYNDENTAPVEAHKRPDLSCKTCISATFFPFKFNVKIKSWSLSRTLYKKMTFHVESLRERKYFLNF